MADSNAKLIRSEDMKAVEGSSGFAALLREEGDNIRRDVFMLLDPEESASGRIQAGTTIIYPGCRTRGHDHGDREEVYYFTRGRGIMKADDEECEVRAGDTYYLRPGPFHTTHNPYDEPLEYFWITIKAE